MGINMDMWNRFDNSSHDIVLLKEKTYPKEEKYRDQAEWVERLAQCELCSARPFIIAMFQRMLFENGHDGRCVEDQPSN